MPSYEAGPVGRVNQRRTRCPLPAGPTTTLSGRSDPILIAPTEPVALRRLGTVSSTPERYGSDILMTGLNGTYGVQRKEIADLVSSYYDGRLSYELSKMKALCQPILLLEGQVSWMENGYLAQSQAKYLKAQHLSLIFTLQSEGFWIMSTHALIDTCDTILSLQAWIQKEKHQQLSRPKAKSDWGKASNRDWGIHLLQSWDGIGAETAAAIYDKYRVPLQWTVTEKELQQVPGVGPKRARNLITSL